MNRHSLERVTVEHPAGPFTFLLIVNDNSRQAARVQTAGWWGRLNTNDMQPFVLLPDGRLDFGAYPEDELEHHKAGRFAGSRIFEARIAERELVWLSIWGDDDDDDDFVEGQYPITAVQELLGSSPRAQIQA